MSPVAGFVLSFALTLALLGLVVATGLRARRRLHIAAVALSLAALGVTIRCALGLGELYDLPAAGVITPIHLALAKATTACYLLPIATGIRTIFVPSTRRLHRKLAFLVLGMTALSAVTGTVMMILAPRAG